MTEYINKEDIIPYSIDDDYEEGGERLIVDYKDIEEMPQADVIERSEYNELNEKYFKAIHNHTECLKKLHEYRSKIDNAIQDIELEKHYLRHENIELDKMFDKGLDKALEILKRNIGE